MHIFGFSSSIDWQFIYQVCVFRGFVGLYWLFTFFIYLFAGKIQRLRSFKRRTATRGSKLKAKSILRVKLARLGWQRWRRLQRDTWESRCVCVYVRVCVCISLCMYTRNVHVFVYVYASVVCVSMCVLDLRCPRTVWCRSFWLLRCACACDLNRVLLRQWLTAMKPWSY